jgi:hypothetical protein
MHAHRRVVALIAIVLTSGTVSAGQLPVRIDLAGNTAEPNLEYYLEIGSVLRNGSPTTDMAICLSYAKITPYGLIRSHSSELVAFVAANERVVEAIATAQTTCSGSDCTEIQIKTRDHNVEIDPAPLKRLCADPSGIARQFGYAEIVLGELRPETRAEIELAILNTYDSSMMLFGVAALGLRQTCEVPEFDTDIRYGRGWRADLWSPSPWLPGYSLWVCSEGVRVCSFSSDFMSNEFHQAIIRANDLDNTVIHASSSAGYFGGHECGLGRDAVGGAIGRYFVEGWVRSWQIGLRIDALGGNDWVLGSPKPDLLMGGDGDDLLRGMAGSSNRIYGEGGNDIMHDSTTGTCDGGPPEIDTHCALDPWEWPDPYPAGDCCCAGCMPPVSCVHSDFTPGVSEVPPDPW